MNEWICWSWDMEMAKALISTNFSTLQSLARFTTECSIFNAPRRDNAHSFFTTFQQLHKTNAKCSSGTSSSTWKCNESCLHHFSMKCTWMLAYDAIFFIDFMICNANELFKILEITKEDRNQFTAKHKHKH